MANGVHCRSQLTKRDASPLLQTSSSRCCARDTDSTNAVCHRASCVQSSYDADNNLYNITVGAAGAVIASVVEERDADEFAAARQDALERAGARVARHLLTEKHKAAVDSIAEEFERFINGMPGRGSDRWKRMTDLDVLHFLEERYLRDHTGRNGGAIATGTLNSAISCLWRLCTQRGRSGPFWDVQGVCGGNPVDACKVKDFKKAYAVELTDAGVVEISAVPISEAVVRRLLCGLVAEGVRLLGECTRLHQSRAPALRATLDQRMTSDGCRTGHIPRICTNHDTTPPLEASSSTSSTPRIGGTLRKSMPMPGTSSTL